MDNVTDEIVPDGVGAPTDEQIDAYGLTHRGLKRSVNQDQFLVREGIGRRGGPTARAGGPDAVGSRVVEFPRGIGVEARGHGARQ